MRREKDLCAAVCVRASFSVALLEFQFHATHRHVVVVPTVRPGASSMQEVVADSLLVALGLAGSPDLV